MVTLDAEYFSAIDASASSGAALQHAMDVAPTCGGQGDTDGKVTVAMTHAQEAKPSEVDRRTEARAGPKAAPGENRAEIECEGSGGSGAAVATADAAVHLNEEARRSKRRRVSSKEPPPAAAVGAAEPEAKQQGAGTVRPQVAAAAARPPLPPRRSTRAKGGGDAAAQTEDPEGNDDKAKESGTVGPADEKEPDVTATSTAPGREARPEKQKKSSRTAHNSDEHTSTDPGVTDLDTERAEIMERNRRMLMELQLPGLVAGLAAERSGGASGGAGGGGGAARRQASQRGVGAKRTRDASQEPPPPRRVSLRQRGVAADSALAAGIEHETSAGVQLVAGRQAVEAAAGRPAGADAGAGKEPERHPRGELSFRSDNGNEATDSEFLATLKAAAAASGPPSAGTDASDVDAAPRSASDLSGAALARLGLAERDVAKVTKDGVTHLAWLPGSDRLLLAAADKSGKVSLWDVDVKEGRAAADTDGVLMFSPHSEYVSGMRWLGRDAAFGPCRLITAAYDGSLRALDVGGAGTWLELPAPGDPRDNEFSALEVSPDGRTAFLGDPLGNLDLVDLRAPPPRPGSTPVQAEKAAAGPPASTEAVAVGPVGGLQICPRKINSLHLEPSEGHLLASSCSDGTVCIWDVRKLGTAATSGAGTGSHRKPHPHSAKPVAVLHHGKSCHAAYWAHDGSRRLLSTSYDDTIRVWSPGAAAAAAADSAQFAQELSIPHNNQTGRWITPFRAVWSATCDAVLVGNMKRGMDVFSAPPCGATAGAAQGGHGGSPAKSGQAAKGAKGGAKKHTDGGNGAGQLLRTLISEYMTAIPSRMACHPRLPVVVAATSSGRCHVWR